MNTAAPVVEFRIAPEYRRCGIYFTVGFLLIAVELVWIDRAFALMGPVPNSLIVGLCLLSTLGLIPFFPRLRVDEQGIWRRLLLGWDLWSWDDFASGQIKFGAGDRSFVDPRRRWWQPRSLSLAYLDPDDKQIVARWIEIVWQSLRPSVPDEFDIRQGLGPKLHFDDSGIQSSTGKTTRTYAWNDVESLTIERLRHCRDDFRRLTLKLPDQVLKLTFNEDGHGHRNWTGPEPDVVARFLTARIAPEWQFICALFDVPSTLREADWHVAKSEKRLRGARMARRVVLGAVVALLAWFAVDRDPRALGNAIIILVMMVPIMQFQYRNAWNVHEVYLQWREELARRIAHGAQDLAA